MKWEMFIKLCETHDLYPEEVLEMIFAYICEDETDVDLADEILKVLVSENDC